MCAAGTVKGLTSEQLQQLDCHVILGNTYHLANRPGGELVAAMGGLHSFINWPRGILTDSGGFQMVSLLHLADITEEGVTFQSPVDGSRMLLTPEESIGIQNNLGADIMMQLDDVVPATNRGERCVKGWYSRPARQPSKHCDRCLDIVEGRVHRISILWRELEAGTAWEQPGYLLSTCGGVALQACSCRVCFRQECSSWEAACHAAHRRAITGLHETYLWAPLSHRLVWGSTCGARCH